MTDDKKVWKPNGTECVDTIVAGKQVFAELTRGIDSVTNVLVRVVVADETTPAGGLRVLLSRLRGGKREVTVLRVTAPVSGEAGLPKLSKLLSALEKVCKDGTGKRQALIVWGSPETLRLGAFAAGLFAPCEYVALLPSTPTAQLTPPTYNVFGLPGHPLMQTMCPIDLVLCDTSAAEGFSRDDLATGAAWAMAIAATQSASLFDFMIRLAGKDEPLEAFRENYDEIAKQTIPLAFEADDEMRGIDFLAHSLRFPGPGLPPPGGSTSIALAALARISSERGAIPAGEALRVCQTLERFGLPIVSDRPKSLMGSLLAEMQKNERELQLLCSVGGMSSRTAKPIDMLNHL